MVNSHRSIRWYKGANDSFRSAIQYIRKDSAKNAERVKEDLLLKIKALKDHPEKYPVDKYRKGGDGTFRAFELHHYRVSYAVTNTEIIITQIRHTSMAPLQH